MLATIINSVPIIAGIYIMGVSILLKTPNIKTAIYAKGVPFVLGLYLILYTFNRSLN